jgi:hypothetical protein
MGLQYAGWGGPHASQGLDDESLFLVASLRALSPVASPVDSLATVYRLLLAGGQPLAERLIQVQVAVFSIPELLS